MNFEELAEFKFEVEAQSEHIEEEFGDLLFSLVNYARFIDISPESALAFTNQKFIKRFQLMEELIVTDTKDIKELNLEEMDIYWDAAKKIIAENQSL